MALLKLSIFVVIVAVALAHHGGGRGGHRSSEENEDNCGQPEGISNLDQTTQQQITAIWTGYVPGTNCSTQLEAQKLVFDALHAAELAAKVANLTAAARTVYNDQIKPILDNTTIDFKAKMPQIEAIVDAQTPEIQDELNSLQCEHGGDEHDWYHDGGHGDEHGGRHGGGHRHWTTTTVPSA